MMEIFKILSDKCDQFIVPNQIFNNSGWTIEHLLKQIVEQSKHDIRKYKSFAYLKQLK